MKKYLIIAFTICLIIVIGAVYFLQQNKTESEKIIQETINSLDPVDPMSFLIIQDVIDLGEEAIEPLLALSDSHDELTQWTVVVGLASLRHKIKDQSVIGQVMQDYYQSNYSSIRLRAAASNLEFGDDSGLSILQAAGESDTAMSYILPPMTEAEFAGTVLEWAGYQINKQ